MTALRLRGIIVLSVALGACYETKAMVVNVRTANTRLDCFAVADRIAVSVQSGRGKDDEQGRCEFALQALSKDEGCGMQCPLTPQRGETYDRAVDDMAKQLGAAFGERHPPE